MKGVMRAFHTSRVTLAFRQSTGKGSGSEKPSSTPRKSNGEYRWYEIAAPYSNFHKRAPEVPTAAADIIEPSAESLSQLKSGQLIAWPSKVEAFLHHVGSFKPVQQNELFQSHVSVVRKETENLWSKNLKPGHASLIVGDSGVGKTSLLAQAHAAAKTKGWGVIHITQVDKLLTGSTDAVYDTASKLWNQPMFMSQLYKKVLKANRGMLATTATAPATLAELNKLFEGKNVLVTADNINALAHMPFAENTNEKNEKLYHNDLEVVNTLLKWTASVPKNIAVITATSGNFKPIDWTGYAYAPITDYDPELVGKLSKADRIDLGRLTGPETKSFVNYLHAAQVTQKPWEELFQVGNGNPRTVLTAATNFVY